MLQHAIQLFLSNTYVSLTNMQGSILTVLSREAEAIAVVSHGLTNQPASIAPAFKFVSFLFWK